jgi:putative lipoic acid-binding regulatory protein
MMKTPIKNTLPQSVLSKGAPADAPKIEFPCANYPIKVVGKCIAGYDAIIIEMMKRHDAELDIAKVTGKNSAKGTFRSITLYITAQSTDHLETLHAELMTLECVKMVI